MASREGTHTNSFLYCSPDAGHAYVESSAAIERIQELVVAVGDGGFPAFETLWSQSRPCGDTPWPEVRGPYGESVLNWLFHVRRRSQGDAERAPECMEIIQGVLAKEPGLVAVVYDAEPFMGMGVLHQACAAGDVELVEALTGSQELVGHFGPVGLEGRMSATFLRDVPKSIEEVFELATPGYSQIGRTALQVALLACDDTEASLQIVRLLALAGAQLETREGGDPAGKVVYTALHVIARSRSETVNHVSAERTVAVLELFLDPKSDMCGKVDVRTRNPHGFTPLHVAAMMGNEAFFVASLELQMVEVWQWGNKQEAAFSLKDLDGGPNNPYMSALELIVIYKRGNLIKLGLVSEIINEKWSRFGQKWMWTGLAFQLVQVALTAVVCLDDTRGYHAIRWYSRNACIAISSGYIALTIIMWVVSERKKPFFQMLDVRPWSVEKIDVWSLLTVRNALMSVVMCVLALAAPWYHTDVANPELYAFWWHVITSLWWLFLIAFSLRYFELFETTGQIASAIPLIVKKDMLPFGCFFIVTFLCSAIALRVSTTGSPSANDAAAGSFLRALYTLEEAIHGPDVSWRAVVEHHPHLSGAIFVAWLYMMLMMVSLLTAMFTNRYDSVRDHVLELFLFRRAEWTCSLEKMFPKWYHNWDQCKLGIKLGTVKLASTARGPRGSRAHIEQTTTADLEAMIQQGESQPLLDGDAVLSRYLAEPHRLFLWRGTAESFKTWKEPVHHTNYFSL